MSLTGALSAALSGLRANQEQMRVISGNVSNAGVEGFTRKTAPQATQVVGLSTNGGVVTGEVQREVDQFLASQIREGATTLSFEETRQTFLQRVQDFFGTLQSDSNLSNKINQFRQNLEALAIEPENSAAQATVVQQAVALTRDFQDFTQKTQDLRGEADLQIDLEVDKINENLVEVRNLNVQIAQAKGSGQSTATLEDQRDLALKELSKSLDISTFERASGEVVVVLNQGSARPLVDGSVEQLSFGAAGSLGSGEPGGPVSFADGTDVSPDVGGRLGALLQARDQDLPNFQADLDRLAAMLREQVNEAHNTGMLNNQAATAATGLTGAHRFDTSAQTLENASGTLEIVAVNPDGTVANDGSGNARVISIDLGTLGHDGTLGDGTGGGFLGALNGALPGTGFGITAPDANGRSQITLTDPFGDGSDFVIRSQGARIDSHAINALDTSDPSSAGANIPDRNFAHFFGFNNFFETPDEQQGFPESNPDMITGDMALPGGTNAPADTGNGISAASTIRVREDIVAAPARLSRIEANTGVGEPALPNGEPTISQRMAQVFDEVFEFRAPADLRISITERSQTGVNDPDGPLTAAPPAGLGVGAPSNPVIQVNGVNVNVPNPANASLKDVAAAIQASGEANARVVEDGGSYFLEVRPQDGSTLTLADAGGNNVISNLNMQQQTVQGDQTTGNIGARTVTLANFAGDILQFQAGETSRLNESVEANQQIQDNLQFRLDNQSGVNLDQELANLTEFQQAFNASARVITTVNEMFDTLSAMAR